jgi:hypothetical protein
MAPSPLQQILLHLFRQNHLATAYLFSLPHKARQRPQCLTDWALDLINLLIEKPWDQHPDVMILSPQAKSASYTQEQYKELLNHLQQDPFSLPIKIFLVEKAHLLPEFFLNKLLKTLEDPPLPLVFFFLNPLDAPLLGTFKSRCLSWTLSTNDLPPSLISVESPELKSLWEQCLHDLHHPQLLQEGFSSAAHQFFKSGPEQEMALLATAIRYVSQHPDYGYKEREEFLKKLSWFFQGQKHHLSTQERWIQLILSLRSPH